MKICDGMIIQRDSNYPIWTDEKVSVLFNGITYDSIECAQECAQECVGKWLIALQPVPAGGPYTLEITSKNERRIYKDIYAGDLWLCAGQSNMEMEMARLKDNFGEEWDESINNEIGAISIGFPLIRQFKAPQEFDFSGPKESLSGGSWIQVSKETLDEFTAVGWFFAKYLYEKYRKVEGQTVPIGLINAAWGGTPVESWMSRDALASYPAIIADGEQYAVPGKIEEITQRTAYSILEWETNLNNEDVGFPLGWENPEADFDRDWDEINLPGDFFTQSKDDELKNFCGSIWLAKDFEASAEFAKQDAKVWLGTIIDADTVFINGKEIGNTTYRYPPRKYSAQGFLKEGKNRIVIRVACNNGQGGITPDNPFRIFTKNETIELSGAWKYKIGAVAPSRPEEFFVHYKPMGNFNAMISPILRYPLKGVVWYQGESNEGRPHEYGGLFQKMILDWRAKYETAFKERIFFEIQNINKDKSMPFNFVSYKPKEGTFDLPFLFVQLPIYREPSDNNENAGWALIREAQAQALSLPLTGMAAAWEFGEWNDLHPINKKDAGYRLFLSAEKLLFGVENTSPGPMVQRWERKGNTLYIYFDNCGTGILITSHGGTEAQREEKCNVSVITGEKQLNLQVTIETMNCISVDLSNIKNPKKVLYAWADNPKHRSLYNSEGLPVLPFRIILTGSR